MVRGRRTGKKDTGNSDPASLRGARPWGNFANKYFNAGWCPLPLPPRKKSSPPTGTTGKYEMPTKEKIKSWHKIRDSRGNIAIRVPDDIIGIDVDAYNNKVGRASLKRLEEEFGELPPTWTLTSRRDGVSGIRFYKVPPGLHWPGEPLPDIQIVQHHHRYAVTYPSVHPDTRALYYWYAPGDELNGRPTVTVENEIPRVEEIDNLPQEWVEGLTSNRQWEGLASDENATREDIANWIKARPAGEMCRLMRKQVKMAIEEIQVGGAHDTLNSRIYSIINLATEGHAGVSRALSEVRSAFYEEVMRPGRKGRRTRSEAVNEFARVRDGAVRIMMASVADGESGLEDECACAGNSLDWGEKLGVVIEEGKKDEPLRRPKMGKAKNPDKYTLDDSGNAEHLLDILNGSAYYVPAEKMWFFWNPKSGAWQPDPHGSRALQAAQLVGKRCRELSDEYMDKLKASGSSLTLDTGGNIGDKIKQLDRHAKVSSDHKGLTNMVKIAGAQYRAERRSEDFDAHRDLLACTNGTLELSRDGVVFRQSRREDFLSVTTGTTYDPRAESPAWTAYLNRFLPDLELRRYVQKIAGYSLLGINDERKIFFLQGGTSTGKSTFGKAIINALGQHAGTMNLSLFRDSQDEKPRPDLIRSLVRRVLVAFESSQEWHLHGDQVKRLTGADPIKARTLHSSVYVDRVPAFTPWVVTNSMPTIHGADKALHRRMIRVPFREAIEPSAEDFSVGIALERGEGRSAVLAWMVAGWELYLAEGMTQPEVVTQSTAEMVHELSDLDAFLHEVTEPAENGYVVFTELFDRWNLWAEEGNVETRGMSANKFGRDLSGKGYENTVRKIRGKSVRVRTGLRWRKT